MLQRMLLLMLLSCAAMLAHAKVVVVSPNGDELQQAFDNAAAGDIFFLKNGTYERTGSGMFTLPTNAKQNSIDNITIIGESRDGVHIVADTVGAADSANTMYLRGNSWYIANITVENRGTKAQARALRTRGDRMILHNVRQLSHQDTHLANGGMQYCYKCETWGDVDFIYGDAAIMYDSSLIVSRKRKGGYITAPEDSKVFTGTFKHGTLIKNSELRAEEGLGDNTCSLGRPWQPNNSSVFFNCILGSHIRPEGWAAWGDKPGTYMAEWNSRKPDGTPVDVSQRVAWSTQLTAEDTSKYSMAYFFKGWNPRAVISATLDAPFDLRVDGDSLRWRAMPSAIGYLIYRNGSLLSFTEDVSFDISGKIGDSYAVSTVNERGIPGSAIPRLENIITWEQDTVAAYGEPNIVLTATANSGLPISYHISDTTVLRLVNGNELEILWSGAVTVTATQGGSAAYAPAISVSKNFTVLDFRPPTETGVNRNNQIPLAVYPNPVEGLLNLRFDAEDTYSIFLTDMTGVVVYRASVKCNSHTINVASYPSGTYLLSVENAQKKRTVQKVGIR